MTETTQRVVSTEEVDAREWKNGHTIEIDDAGTGDLVGDAFIGFHDLDTDKMIFRGVPVGLYNEENRPEGRPQEHILEMVKDGLKALNYREGDRILLCRGNCFDLVREYFDEEGIYYEPAIVEGKLQESVEGRFIAHLRKLGIRSKNLTTEAGAKRYWIMFNWVCRDLPRRKNFVKTGFPHWKKYRLAEAEKRYRRRKRGRR
jgi:hypothetical protein